MWKHALAPNTSVDGFHDKGDLRKDFLYNANTAHRFWLGWMQGYLPLLQKRNKWRTVQHNLQPGQILLVEDSEDLSYGEAYRLGRVEKLHSQIRKVKEIVRRATVAVLSKKLGKDDPDIEYVYGTSRKSPLCDIVKYVLSLCVYLS